MRLGIIGTGSMGRTLIHAFTASQAPDLRILACNRSPEKLAAICRDYPSVVPTPDIVDLAVHADVVFLCVKPADAGDVLAHVAPVLRHDQYFVSLLSALSIQRLEGIVPCKVVKLIPSITQQVRSGTALVVNGTRLSEEDTEKLSTLLHLICEPRAVAERDIRISSDLTSCGPAFLCYLLSEMATAAARQGDIPESAARAMITSMLAGTAKLLQETDMTFDHILERVSVPGGITSAGLDTLRGSIPGMFDHLFAVTRAKGEAHAPRIAAD